MTRVAQATVDLAALRHNFALARAAAPNSRIMAVLKANAYGHGLLPVARALSGADAFAVSCLEEAVPLRDAGYMHRIVLLEGFFAETELPAFSARRLDAVIHAPWQVEILERRELHRPLDVWLKVDSGMHRLGFAVERVAEIHRRLSACPGVARIRFLTHLASADNRGDPRTHEQIAALQQACAVLSGERSLANSAATLGWPETHAEWVRPGIMLYGCSPYLDEGERPLLRPALTLEARLIAVNARRRGERIGYGGVFSCPEDMPIGVVSIGYGDGYPRHAPNGTPMLVHGKPAALAGRVSMDMLCVDLRNRPEAQVGDPVVLWGEGLPAETVAAHCDTIAYELLCRLTSRLAFRYVDSERDG